MLGPAPRKPEIDEKRHVGWENVYEYFERTGISERVHEYDLNTALDSIVILVI